MPTKAVALKGPLSAVRMVAQLRKWRIVALVGAMVLALIGGSSAAWADDPSPSPSPSPSASADAGPVGSISGVVSIENGASPEGVQVIADYLDPQWGGWTWKQTTNVAADGTYTLSDLADGDYRIDFRSGSATTSVMEQWWNGAGDLGSATTVTIANGSVVNGISPTLTVGASISGTVTTASGAAVIGGSVTATDATTGAYGGYTTTDITGAYDLEGLKPGSYLLQFQPGYLNGSLAGEWWNDAPSRSTATPITVQASRNITDISPILAPAGSITGVVRADSGAPAANTYISVYEATTGDWMSSGMTDVTGAYTVTGLSAGTYKVEFSSGGSLLGEWYDNATSYESATPVSVAPGVSTSADGILATGATVTGKVVDSKGNPVDNVIVFAQPADGHGYSSGTSTAPDGTYAITGLESGAYQVQFDTSLATQNVASEWWKGTTAGKAKVLQLAAGAVTSGINARLDDGVSVAGTVRDDSGAPVANAYISVYDSAQQVVGSAWSAADGSYTVRGLPSGDLRLRFSGQSGTGPIFVEWWNGASTMAAATPITVKTGQIVRDVNVNLSSAGGGVAEAWNASISGVLTDGLGHPIAGAAVTAESSYMGDIAQTDANGAWSMTSMAAGDYRISFTADVGGSHIVQWWNGAASRDTATPVALGSGEQRTGINASLGAGALPAIPSAQPKITGPARVGAVLKANPGSWTNGTAFTYQWFADGSPIGGETGASFAVTPDLVHKQVTVLVTGSLAGYQSVSRSSAPTVPIPVP